MLQSQDLKRDLPKFIIASTSHSSEETFIFEAENAEGHPKILKWGGIEELTGWQKGGEMKIGNLRRMRLIYMLQVLMYVSKKKYQILIVLICIF